MSSCGHQRSSVPGGYRGVDTQLDQNSAANILLPSFRVSWILVARIMLHMESTFRFLSLFLSTVWESLIVKLAVPFCRSQATFGPAPCNIYWVSTNCISGCQILCFTHILPWRSSRARWLHFCRRAGKRCFTCRTSNFFSPTMKYSPGFWPQGNFRWQGEEAGVMPWKDWRRI